MVKKISIAIIIAAVVFGIVAVRYKTMKKDAAATGEVQKIEETVVPEPTGVTQSSIITPTPTASNAASAESNPPSGEAGAAEIKKGPYPMEIDTKKSYEATLKTTAGDITIALTASATPVTVNNFVSLARKKFYDNTIFHRVIKGFMIQGGDPTGTGSGGPGYTFADEPFAGEYTRGTVAMANAGPNTNGSQFFIMHGDMRLPKNYVIFGRVIRGIEVVDKIAAAAVAASPGGEQSKPVTPVTVTTVEIAEK